MPNSLQKSTVHKAAHSCRKFNPLGKIDVVTSSFLSWSHQQADSFNCPVHTLTPCPTEFHIVEDFYRVDGFTEKKKTFFIQLDEVKDRVKDAQWLIYRWYIGEDQIKDLFFCKGIRGTRRTKEFFTLLMAM